MFGKSLSEYVRFQRWFLVLIVVVFAIRLIASLAGLPIEQTRWLSVNALLLAGLVYFPLAVHRRGFGGYKQLFGLLLVQNFLAQFLIALAVVLGIVTGVDNIFTAPEYSGGADGKTWLHAGAHLVGWIPAALIGWLIGSLILLVARKLQPRARVEAASR